MSSAPSPSPFVPGRESASSGPSGNASPSVSAIKGSVVVEGSSPGRKIPVSVSGPMSSAVYPGSRIQVRRRRRIDRSGCPGENGNARLLRGRGMVRRSDGGSRPEDRVERLSRVRVRPNRRVAIEDVRVDSVVSLRVRRDGSGRAAVGLARFSVRNERGIFPADGFRAVGGFGFRAARVRFRRVRRKTASGVPGGISAGLPFEGRRNPVDAEGCGRVDFRRPVKFGHARLVSSASAVPDCRFSSSFAGQWTMFSFSSAGAGPRSFSGTDGKGLPDGVPRGPDRSRIGVPFALRKRGFVRRRVCGWDLRVCDERRSVAVLVLRTIKGDEDVGGFSGERLLFGARPASSPATGAERTRRPRRRKATRTPQKSPTKSRGGSKTGAVQDIFRRYGPECVAKFGESIPENHMKAIEAIIDCRSGARGFTVCECEKCGDRHSILSIRRRG